MPAVGSPVKMPSGIAVAFPDGEEDKITLEKGGIEADGDLVGEAIDENINDDAKSWDCVALGENKGEAVGDVDSEDVSETVVVPEGVLNGDAPTESVAEGLGVVEADSVEEGEDVEVKVGDGLGDVV